MRRIVAAGVVLLVPAVVFGLLQRRWPAHAHRRTLRDTITDLAYLVFNPLVTRTFTRLCVGLVGG